MATDPEAARPWAWPTIAVGVLIFTGSALGEGDVDVRALARAGAQSALGLLLVGVGGAAVSRRPIRETLRAGPSVPPLSRFEGVAWVLGLLALSLALDRGMEWQGVREGSRLAELEAVLSGMQRGDLALALAGIALAPAIAEEIVFRGLLLGGLMSRTPAWAAVALSALVFGAAHFDLVHGVAAAVLGVYLALVTLAARSVRPAIVAHAINNAFALLAPMTAPALEDAPAVAAALSAVLAGGFVAAVVTLLGRLAPRALSSG